MITAETIGGGGPKRVAKGCIQVWYIWHIVTSFVNTTMYPHPAQWKKIRILFKI
jgi:hypothetical protein